MVGSANLNIMMKAARKAGRALAKDFREVENLQVSTKGAGDFVSKADLTAERLLKDELLGARPTYGWLAEEGSKPCFQQVCLLQAVLICPKRCKT
jgi:myo-inositol-1(or 4)-monophosphatase